MLIGIKVNTDGTLVVVQIEDANHVTGIQQALDARWYEVASMRPGLDVTSAPSPRPPPNSSRAFAGSV